MNEQDQQQLQRFLDGLLAGEERQAFERRLEFDPELRSQLEFHESVVRSLRRTFVPPSIEIPREPTSPTIYRWPWFVLGAAAATLACWLILPSTEEHASDSFKTTSATAPSEFEAVRAIVGSSWVAIYDQVAVRANAPVEIVSCTVATELPEFVQPLVPNQSEPFSWTPQPNISFRRGLDPNPTEDRVRILEFVAAPDATILVFVLRASDDPRVALPAAVWSRSLRLYRAERGALVLYELSPFAHERALPGLAANGDQRK